jgi:hypothetical protein
MAIVINPGKSLNVILQIPNENFSELLKQFADFIQSVCKERYGGLQFWLKIG